MARGAARGPELRARAGAGAIEERGGGEERGWLDSIESFLLCEHFSDALVGKRGGGSARGPRATRPGGCGSDRGGRGERERRLVGFKLESFLPTVGLGRAWWRERRRAQGGPELRARAGAGAIGGERQEREKASATSWHCLAETRTGALSVARARQLRATRPGGCGSEGGERKKEERDARERKRARETSWQRL